MTRRAEFAGDIKTENEILFGFSCAETINLYRLAFRVAAFVGAASRAVRYEE